MGKKKTVGRSIVIRHAKKRAYLKALEQVGAITVAADSAGISRLTPLDWRAKDPDFVAAEQTALSNFADRLEREAVRRAVRGIRKKKFTGKGEAVIDPDTGEQYIEREFSDTLLIFMLKGARPDKYKDRLDVRVAKEEAELDERFTKLVEALANRTEEGVAGAEGNGSLRIEDSSTATPEAEGLPLADL